MVSTTTSRHGLALPLMLVLCIALPTAYAQNSTNTEFRTNGSNVDHEADNIRFNHLNQPPEVTRVELPKETRQQAVQRTNQQQNQAGPDERILWQLLHNKKIQPLKKVIRDWQVAYPNWQPHMDLINAINSPLSSTVPTDPPLSRCKNLNQLAQTLTNNEREKTMQALDILDECTNDEERLALLEMSQPLLLPTPYDRLTAAVSDSLADSSVSLKQHHYQQHRYWLEQWLKQPDTVSTGTVSAGIEPLYNLIIHMSGDIDNHKDAALAQQLGWYFIEQKQSVAAADWFGKANRWKPSDSNIRYGLALAHYQSKNWQAAEHIAKQDQQHSTRMRALLTDSLLQQGWAHYKQADYSTSLAKAEAAESTANQQQHISVITLQAWSQYQLGHLNDAETLALAYQDSDSDSDATQLLGLIYLQRGWAAVAQKKPASIRQYAKVARHYHANLHHTNTLLAWADFHAEDYAAARDRFEQLYKEKPDKSLAAALIESQRKIDGNVASLAVNTSDHNSELRPLNRQTSLSAHHNNLYNRKLFLAAAAVNEGRLNKGSLNHIDSTSAEVGLLWRQKSGASGTSRLDIQHQPVWAGHYNYKRVHTFSLKIHQVTLESGSLNLNSALVGSTGLNSQTGQDLTTRLSRGFSYRFDYQREGWRTPYLSVGRTPNKGVINTALTYELGFTQQVTNGHWRGGLYARPVRESILSYTGIKDPYSGARWGRVIKTGLALENLHHWSPRWSSVIAGQFATLEGDKVISNQTIEFDASLGYNLNRSGYNYLTVGPEFSYRQFDKNLSYFTLGHGGYFSPDNMVRLSVGLNLLTSEARRHVIQGRLSLGYQRYKEAAALWFPNPNAFDSNLTSGGLSNVYAANSQSGLAYDLQLKGVYLSTPHWQLHGGVSLRKSDGYQDIATAIGIRFYIEPRSTSFSRDIPRYLFRTLY